MSVQSTTSVSNASRRFSPLVLCLPPGILPDKHRLLFEQRCGPAEAARRTWLAGEQAGSAVTGGLLRHWQISSSTKLEIHWRRGRSCRLRLLHCRSSYSRKPGRSSLAWSVRATMFCPCAVVNRVPIKWLHILPGGNHLGIDDNSSQAHRCRTGAQRSSPLIQAEAPGT